MEVTILISKETVNETEFVPNVDPELGQYLKVVVGDNCLPIM